MLRGWRTALLVGIAIGWGAPAGIGQEVRKEAAGAEVLMPLPAQLTRETGELRLTSMLDVRPEGVPSERLDRAIARAMVQLRAKTGLPAKDALDKAEHGPVLAVQVQREGDAVQAIDEDESYRLRVTAAGVRIEAATVAGAMHGLQTMIQLVQPLADGYVLPLVTIDDAPRFRWRGLMVDCGRHFEPVEVIKRTLDGMAMVKMNVFHWHLTEDQGFRMQSKLYPALTAKGSDGLFYTQEEAVEIVRYARDRGIRVVPEFEMPGHSTAWLVAYPKLSSGKAPEGIRREFGVSDYAIDPTREETYTFLNGFLTEMAGIFPDAYIHIGGDETPAPEWKTNPRILAFMRAHQLKDSDALQAYFNQRLLKILAGLHRRMVGWDEIFNPALPKDVVIQSWRGEASLTAAAKQGYQGVLSAPYYLDEMKTAGVHYLADPLPSTAELTAEQRSLVLGGEVCMWGEQLDARTIDSRIWPRTAAIAERFWSQEPVRDVEDMYRRLDALSVELESVGLRHLAQQDVGLRELAGKQDIAALRVLASVLEPVSFGERYEQQKTSQLTALDRFVDAVRPDPPSRREMQRITAGFLRDVRSDDVDRRRLLERFHAMSAAVPEVRRQMERSPRLRDVTARVDQLAALAQAGTEAVSYLSAGTTAPPGWHSRVAELMAAAKKPSGIVRFTMLDSLSELFAAVR